jgi:hypothetical protein
VRVLIYRCVTTSFGGSAVAWVGVHLRAGEGSRQGQRQTEGDRKTENVCLCVCVRE